MEEIGHNFQNGKSRGGIARKLGVDDSISRSGRKDLPQGVTNGGSNLCFQRNDLFRRLATEMLPLEMEYWLLMMRGKVKRKGVGTRIENLTLVGVEF